ncbi:hypothetical protein KR059_006561 [Drosophila kikkawai]|nr:hypothetical protein KR059_006561 [Drosophila kikkawai]
MTTPVPRRTKDMMALASDSDTEDNYNTPFRPKSSRGAAEIKKPPVVASTLQKPARGKENEADPHLLHMEMLPRRASELTMMNSDSEEEEDNKNNHNLNCAILNDSFVLSPNHELTGSSHSIPTRRTSPAAASAAPLKASESNLSFLGRFNNMGINCSSQGSPDVEAAEQVPAKKPLSTTQGIAERRQLVDTALAERRRLMDTKTPLRKGISASSSSTVEVKSHAKPEADFVTPQVRAYGSIQSAKNRGPAAANEFRSQKVLFQTPMTVSRAAPFPNDSISFSLCDTISESPNVPEPPPKQESMNGKSKKSLESAFSALEKVEKVPPKVVISEAKEVVASVPLATTDPVVPNPGGTAPSKTSNILNIKNNEYTIVKKLGCGGSSSVYLARRSDSGDEFALKVVDLQADPLVVQGYLNETKLLAKLQGNVCVVALYDYQLLREESKLYMVMEKGDSDLNKILQNYTTNLPLYSLTNILYQMLQAVNYIHQHGVIHSDLKPANFLMVNGRLKLIDFGIASNISVDSTSIIKFSQAGTFNYISPEALTDTSTGNSPLRGGGNQPKIKISTKSDVWSLGCILYLLLYQKTPFGHIRNIYAKMNAIASPATSIEYPAIPPYYPVMLVHMTKNCLQLNPKNRPSCTELLQYPFQMIIPLHNLQIPPSRGAPSNNN